MEAVVLSGGDGGGGGGVGGGWEGERVVAGPAVETVDGGETDVEVGEVGEERGEGEEGLELRREEAKTETETRRRGSATSSFLRPCSRKRLTSSLNTTTASCPFFSAPSLLGSSTSTESNCTENSLTSTNPGPHLLANFSTIPTVVVVVFSFPFPF